MRFYFDLIGPDVVLRDEVGAKASDLSELRTEVSSVINEVSGDEDQMQDVTAWEMHVRDEAGMIVIVISLASQNVDAGGLDSNGSHISRLFVH